MGLVIVVWFMFLGCAALVGVGVVAAVTSKTRTGRVHPLAVAMVIAPLAAFVLLLGLIVVDDGRRRGSIAEAEADLDVVAASLNTEIHSRVASGGRCNRASGYTNRPVPEMSYVTEWEEGRKHDELAQLERELTSEGWAVTALRRPDADDDGALIRRDDIRALIVISHFDLVAGFGDIRGPGEYTAAYRIEVWDGIGCRPLGRP